MHVFALPRAKFRNALGGKTQGDFKKDIPVQPRFEGASASAPRPEPHAHIDRRPWGQFSVLALNDRVSVKILTVSPGSRLSLQRHEWRDEWWHILDEGFVVEIDGEERSVAAGDQVWIPRGEIHRVGNVGDKPARFVEVAFGHFDEGDIERLGDDFGRAAAVTNWPPSISEERRAPAPALTVLVPSFNERDNVEALVRGIGEALDGAEAEILYVDDSTDDTADVVRRLAVTSKTPLRVMQRDKPTGGLAGAVRDGLCQAKGAYVVVMDGDLQHPPELIPTLLQTAQSEQVDMVVASRYCGDGDASGLSTSWRRSVSSISTLLARACFPRRVGRLCSDPMTGFFCVRREAVDTQRLRPRGFKVLLEILARHELRVSEIPFTFGEREAGASKASWRHGVQFLLQMASLRMGRMSRFAVVGAMGALVNLALMWALLHSTGLHYVAAAVVATEMAIMHNFILQERFVFADMRGGQHGYAARLGHFFAFNNAEALLRMPLLVLLVTGLGMFSVIAQALTLALAFLARFFWMAQVVYGPNAARTSGRPSPGWVSKDESVAA